MRNLYAHSDLSKPETLEKIDKGRKRTMLVGRLALLSALVVLLGSAWVFAAVGFSWQTGLALGVTFWVLFIYAGFCGWIYGKSGEDLIERAEEIAAERKAAES